MISEQALDWTKRRRKTVNDPNQPSYDQGGDWGGNTNAPQGGVGPAPDTRPPGERGHGIGDGIGGPDDSTPLFPDVQINTKVFFSRIKGPILKAFLAITVLTVLVAVLKLMVNVVLGFVGVGPMVIQISSGLFQFMLALVGLVVGVLQVALYAPARNAMMMNTPDAPTSIGEVFAQAKGGIPKALGLVLLTSMVIGIASGCCGIPGIIAFILLWPARYLVIARGMDLTSGINASMDIGKKYWVLFIVMMVAAFVLFVAVGAVLGILGAIVGVIMGVVVSSGASIEVIMAVSAFLGFGVDVIGWIVGALVGVAFWCVEGGIMTTLEVEEYGELVAP